MNFNDLVSFLQQRLQKPLPGAKAHGKMKPVMANGAPIRIKHHKAAKEGAVLILLNQVSGQPRFPLIQRPEYDGVHSGQIALPGGKKESEDTSLIATAQRETEEEIGIDRHQIRIIGNLSPFYVAASNFNVLPVVGVLYEPAIFKADPREVQEIINPAIASLLDPKNRQEGERSVGGSFKLVSPQFLLEDKEVWGATAMILSEFESILQEFTVR
ncbi:MAG: CoA pyrophosphatase [Bacteroidota bacterium]